MMLSAVLANGCRHGPRKMVHLRDADCIGRPRASWGVKGRPGVSVGVLG